MHKILPLIFTAIFFNIQVFSWTLEVVNEKKLPNASGYYTEYKLNQSKHFPVTVRSVYIDQSKYNSSIVAQTINNRQLLMYLSKQEGALIAINGGYFRENFLPNGLLISKNRKISRLVKNNLLDGVVTNDKQGFIKLMPTENYKGAFSAFQSGPELYDSAGWKSLSPRKKRRRNIIMQFDNGNILLVNMTAVTLANAIEILRKIVLVNQYDNIDFALNLDGGRSAAFVINFDDAIIVPEDDYIKTAILFKLK